MKKINISSKKDLEKIVEDFASKLKPGDVLALKGDLGTGKTTFTQMLGQKLSIKDEITSPTFTLIHQYPWFEEHLLYHLDLYRVKNEDELKNLGLEELLLSKNHLLIVEWPELITDQLPTHTKILQFTLEGDLRTLQMTNDSDVIPQQPIEILTKTIVSSNDVHDSCLYIDSSKNVELKLSFNAFHKTIQYKSPRDQDTVKEIHSFLSEHLLTLQHLKSIKVAQGPGSFTSLRTGIASAQALALALHIPINNQLPGSTIEAHYGASPNIGSNRS